MDCEIIRDILPLYAEDLASEKSKHAVTAHLNNCTECRRFLLELQKETVNTAEYKQNIKPLKKIQMKLTLIAVLLVTAVSLFWGLILMQPGDEMAYSLLVFYMAIPLLGCVVSGILTLKTKVIRWFTPFLFALINLILPLAVFGTPELITAAIAFGASCIGMGWQFLIIFIKRKFAK